VSPASFAATATPGIFTGNVTGLDVTNCQEYSPGGAGCTADAFTYYLVNAGTVVGIENDGNQLTLLRFELQQ
jgi:predicted RNA methylase